MSANLFSFITLFCILFFYTLNTTIVVYGAKVALALVAVLTSIFIFLFEIKKIDIKVSGWVLIGVAFFLLIGGYSSVVGSSFGYDGARHLFFKIALSNSVYLVFSFCFSLICIKRNYDIYDVIRILFFVSLTNAIVVLISFLYPEIKGTIESLLHHSQNSNINYLENNWRLRGLAAAGGASASLFMALCILFGILAVEAKRLSEGKFLIGSLLILASLTVVGRTGLIFGMILLSCWTLRQLLKCRTTIILYLVLSILLMAILYTAFHQHFERIIPYAFELFINFFSGQGVSSRSTDHLMTMLNLPSEATMIVMGFGCFEGCTIYRSDSGYLKTIASIGLPLTVLYYVTYAVLLLKLVPNNLNYGRGYWFFSIILLFLCEIKEPFLYQNYTGRALLLIIIFAAAEMRYKKIKTVSENYNRYGCY